MELTFESVKSNNTPRRRHVLMQGLRGIIHREALFVAVL